METERSAALQTALRSVIACLVTERFEIECNTNVNRRFAYAAAHFYTEYLQTLDFE